MKRSITLFSLFALLGLLAGCVTQDVAPDPTILRIGVTPRSQPMIFKQGDQISGIEADFARKVGKALNRKVVFVEVPWEKQIDYLTMNKTDIIMSNMTITGTRGIRINFTTPYMQSGLSGLFRRDNYDPAGLLASTIRNQTKRIGYVKDTTSEFFVMSRFPRADKKPFANTAAALSALKANRVDMIIQDAPIVWWLSAMNEGDLVAFPDILNIEPIAWGVSKQNLDLLDQLNELIVQWERDGTTQRVIQNWIPNFGK